MKFNFTFFGSTDFSVIVLDELKKAGYVPAVIICAPDKPAGRGKKLIPPPTKIWAERNGVEAVQQIKLIRSTGPIGLIASFGKIIPKETLDLFSKGVLNVHPSLLPKYRGASPIQTTILNGDSETGVTIMLTDEEMDHGPLLAQREFSMTKINYRELHDELAYLGGKLLVETLSKYLKGKIIPTPQDQSQATFTKIFKKEDGHIDWSKSAEDIERQIRAFIKWPTSYTFWENKRLVITQASVGGLTSYKPGAVAKNKESQIVVACGTNALVVERLIPEGKKEMTGEEFLRGNKDILNSTLS